MSFTCEAAASNAPICHRKQKSSSADLASHEQDTTHAASPPDSGKKRIGGVGAWVCPTRRNMPYSSASRPTKYLWSERKYRKEGLPEHPYAPIPRNAFKAPGILHSRSSTPTSEEEPAAVSSGCEPPRIDRKNERRATPTDSLRVGLAEDASPRSRHAGSSSSRKRRTPDNDQQDSASSSQSGSHKRRARSSYISSDEEVELVLGLFDHARSPSPPRRGRSSPTPGSRRLKCIEDSGVHVPEDAAEFLLAPPPKPELFSEELLEESPWWERPGSVSEGVSLPECPESVVAERGSPPPTRPLCQALPFPQYSIFMTDVGAVGGVAYVVSSDVFSEVAAYLQKRAVLPPNCGTFPVR